MCLGDGDCGATVSRRLAIGRKISEFISKSHNARVRYNAFGSFIRLIEINGDDFSSVWNYRMGIPKKRREGEEFLNMLRSHCAQEAEADESGELALKLLWLLERSQDKRQPDFPTRTVRGTIACSSPLVSRC